MSCTLLKECQFFLHSGSLRASLVAQMVKNLPAMRQTQVRSLGQEDRLEKGMTTHFSISTQRIPQTEEPNRSPSTGSQRAGHDWATNTHTQLLHDSFLSLMTHYLSLNQLMIFKHQCFNKWNHVSWCYWIFSKTHWIKYITIKSFMFIHMLSKSISLLDIYTRV